MLSLVQGIRAAGGDVIISFGGASGTELALGCTTVSSLQAAYQSVLNKYRVNASTPVRLDFDIEGGAVTDQASINRRNQALIGLKNANPGLVISYTLPVLPTGLVASGVNMLNSIKASGLSVNVINIMAMDYGSANDNGGQMGLSAVQAASNTPSPDSRCGQSHATMAVARTRALLLLFVVALHRAIGRSRISSNHFNNQGSRFGVSPQSTAKVAGPGSSGLFPGPRNDVDLHKD